VSGSDNLERADQEGEDGLSMSTIVARGKFRLMVQFTEAVEQKTVQGGEEHRVVRHGGCGVRVPEA
jgi:hypothetical protein